MLHLKNNNVRHCTERINRIERAWTGNMINSRSERKNHVKKYSLERLNCFTYIYTPSKSLEKNESNYIRIFNTQYVIYNL